MSPTTILHKINPIANKIFKIHFNIVSEFGMNLHISCQTCLFLIMIRIYLIGLFILIITGIPLFLSEAVKCYYSRAFWIKISCLLLGALFVYFIRNPIVLSKDENFMIKILGFISFSLWVVTAASGRWIGFS